jgi:signal peptidase I
MLTLLVAALVPSLWNWSGYVVRSGSMEPRISVGDVVVAQPFSASEAVPLGRVMIFRNPEKPGSGELLSHRIVSDLGHGRYATAGDANASNDVKPATAHDMVARARILVPFIGLPLMWLENGRWISLLAFLMVSAIALVGARLPDDLRRGPGGRAGGTTTRGSGDGAAGGRPRRGRAAAKVVAMTAAVAGLATTLAFGSAAAAFTASTASRGNTWTVAAQAYQPYTAQVLADAPYLYYQVDEQSGASAADSSRHGVTGTYTSIGAYRQAGALPNNAGYAVRLDGSTGRLVSGGSAVTSPRTFSLELWFKTTTTTGGKLIGFESTRNATSPTFDRHVFMRPDGRLVYGGWSASTVKTIVSPLAYNNGGWHHLVITTHQSPALEQVSVMYVDGLPVTTGTTTKTSNYSGYWRVGYGALPTGTGYPASASFSGTIDQVAVYDTALSAGAVLRHWAAR